MSGTSWLGFGGRTTLDPGGADVGDTDPFPPDGSADPDGLVLEPPGGAKTSGILGAEGGRADCVLDGIEVDCAFIRSETSVQCPDNDCGPKWNPKARNSNGALGAWEYFHAFASGYAARMTQYGRYSYRGGSEFFNSAGDRELGRSRTAQKQNGASVTGGANPRSLLKPGGPVSEAEKILTSSCDGFLNAILHELSKIREPESYSFSSIFNKAVEKGLIHSVKLPDGEYKKRFGGVNAIISDPSVRINVDSRQADREDLSAGYITIHELFHASPASGPMYSHREMAIAAYNVAEADGLLKKLGNTNTPGPPRTGETEADDWYNAGIFDNVVRLGCPKPPPE